MAERNTRDRSGFRAVIAPEITPAQRSDRIRFRQEHRAAIYAVQGFRGLAVQSSPGSGGQEVQEFTCLREVSRFRVGGGDWEFQWGTADVALIQKFIVHRIHTPTVDVDEPS